MSQILCPYCFTKHDFSKSRECLNVKKENIDGASSNEQEEVPLRFIKEYDKVQPLWLITVGFSRHGKTCYQAALTTMIENLSRVWSDSTYLYLDQRTKDILDDARRQAFEGILPPKSTIVQNPRPIFISTYTLPKFSSNCLVLYDTAGELYQKFQGPEDAKLYLQPLKAVRNIWFLVSLRHLKGAEGNPEKKISDLLTNYLDGMQKLGYSLKDRNLIVVYTQADAIVDNLEFGFPEKVGQYLRSDPFQSLADYKQDMPKIEHFSQPDFLDNYIAEMKNNSDELMQFTKRLPGGNAFISLAKMHEMGLYFTIVSALGSEPDPNKERVMMEDMPRYRVLDPFFWALYLNTQPSQQNAHLILDGAHDSTPLYEFNLAQFAEYIQDENDVTTYVMGQTRKVSVVGQAPPKALPAFSRPRLIGPLLEKADKETKFIILTTGKIHDLDEFALPDWYHRILLITVDKDDLHSWPNQLSLRQGDDISDLRNEVLRFLSTLE